MLAKKDEAENFGQIFEGESQPLESWENFKV